MVAQIQGLALSCRKKWHPSVPSPPPDPVVRVQEKAAELMTRTDRAPEDKRGCQSLSLTAVVPQPELDDLLPSPVPLWDQPPSHMYYRNDLKPSQEIVEPLDTATVAHPHVFKNKQMKNWARDSALGLTPTLRPAQLLRGLLGRAPAPLSR